MMQNARKVFAYCHDGVGIGHLYRTLSICEHVGRTQPAASFLVATGTPYVPFFQPLKHVDYIKLPALAKKDNREYASKFETMEPAQLLRCRETVLLNVIRHFLPDVLLIDKAPLGVCRELLPTLEWIRDHSPDTRVIFGMRDIEDSPEATIEQWAHDGVPDALEKCFDEIWVYGNRDVFDVTAEYKLGPAIESKLKYMGYIARDGCTHQATPRNGQHNHVLVTVGGGTDGEYLLRTYLEQAALRVSRMGLKSTIVGGPDLPMELADELRRQAAAIPGVEWIDFDPCLNCRIRDADLVVSMGGYNTLCQIARNRKSALVIPRVLPRLEQEIRARLWAARGVVEALDTKTLSPNLLADRVVHAIENPRDRSAPKLDLNGLNQVGDRFRELWIEEKRDAAAVCV